MDKFDIDSDFPEEEKNLDPIPFDDSDETSAGDKLINMDQTNVSHTPIDLGGSSTSKSPDTEPVEIEGLEDLDDVQIEQAVPVKQKMPSTVQIKSTERITGMKIFFTKLQASSIDFMEQQIVDWLAKNPDISIKRTNAISGPLVGKKTEPNIIITVWY